MENVFSNSHHEIVGRETLVTPMTLCTEPSDEIFFAIWLSLSYKTSAVFIKKFVAVVTLEAGGVPFQVGGDTEDELVGDGTPTPCTHRGIDSFIFHLADTLKLSGDSPVGCDPQSIFLKLFN